MKTKVQLKQSITVFFLLNLVVSTMPIRIEAQTEKNENNKSEMLTKAPKPYTIQPSGYKAKAPSPESRQGEEHFKQLDCMTCHSIHNTGGVIGPLLDGIGARRSGEYLYAHLANTKEAKEHFAQLTNTDINLLHHPRLSEATAKLLVAYLETLPEPPGGFVLYPHIRSHPAEERQDNPIFKPQAQNINSQVGKQLFDKCGCIACHSINNIGGWLGPWLDGIGGRMNHALIAQYINNPSVKIRESTDEQEVWPQMPHLDLSKSEIDKIVDYLMTLPNLENKKSH